MLLERDRELDLLTGLLAGVGTDGGKVVLVRGEGGVGKTALVREFIARVGDEAQVFVGYCDDLGTPQPLGPFWDIGRDEPAVAAAVAAGDRSGLFAALVEALSPRLRPAVMVIEDTQWADEASFDAITYLGRRIAGCNGLLVLTYREEQVDYEHPLRAVMGVLAPSDVARISLGRLSVGAVEELVGESGLDVGAVMDLTAGNPLFVSAVVDDADSSGLPVSIRDALLGKAARLSPSGREVLGVLAVIPQPFPTADVPRLVDGGGEEGLDECVREGFIEVGDGMVGFRHELARRVTEESLPDSERVGANRAVLAALPGDADATWLAHHANQAGDVDALLIHAPAAAEAAAAVGSHREAIRHYASLEPYLDRYDTATRGRLLDAWGHDRRQAGGEYLEAERVHQLRVEHHQTQGDARGESKALADLALAYLSQMRRSDAEAAARRAIDVLGPAAAGSDLLPALEANSYLAMMALDVAATEYWTDRALEASGTDGDDAAVVRCLINRGSAEDAVRYPQGRELVDEAAQRAAAIGLWNEAARALHNHAEIDYQALDLPTATDYALRAIAAAQQEDIPGRESYAHITYATVLEAAGSWREAEQEAEKALSVAGATAAAVNRAATLPTIGVIEARQGRPGAAATLHEAWESTGGEHQRRNPAAAAAAEYAWISGDHVIPAAELTATLDTGLDLVPWWRSTSSLALWLWKLGAIDATPPGIAEPYRLLIDGHPTQAAAQFEQLGLPYEQAIALSHGDPTDQLQALDILDQLGATAVAAKLRQHMRDQGIAVSRGPAPATRAHRAGLTARQAEILELLAEGLTNPDIADRLFISPRTVEHHVSAILSKLDATTRDQAVTHAKEQGLLDAAV